MYEVVQTSQQIGLPESVWVIHNLVSKTKYSDEKFLLFLNTSTT